MPTDEKNERIIERELARLHRGLEAVRRPAGSDRFSTMDRASYLLLDILDTGAQAVGPLAHALHLDQSTVLRQVTTLEQRGLVRKVADKAGGRAALVEVTSQGRRQLRDVRAARAQRVSTVLDDWSTRDRTELARLLGRLNSSLDARLHATGDNQ